MATNNIRMGRLALGLLLTAMMVLSACKHEDDVIVIQQQHNWIEKKVAVVAPLTNSASKTRLERTAKWMLENFEQAQLDGKTCIRLKLDWYNEDTEQMSELSKRLAADTAVVAIVGPFDSDDVATFAASCQANEKPLITPTATSEDIIRRYAVPTQSGTRTVHPFLWSLTETDVAFTEVCMTAFAKYFQYYKSILISVIDMMANEAYLYAPDNTYGQTFFNWAPFQADNLEVNLEQNRRYKSVDELCTLLGKDLNSAKEETDKWVLSAAFCVVEQLNDLVQTAKFKQQWDAQNSNETQVYYAYAGMAQDDLDALSASDKQVMEQVQGFSPYADPTTGFEMSYEERYGVKPTFEECKLYDALLLSALAAYKCAVVDNVETSNRNTNQAIYDLTDPNAEAKYSTAIWRATALQNYLEALRSGEFVKFGGASGRIAFDNETCTAATGTTYVHWQVNGGKLNILNYFSSKGDNRVGEATAAWKYLYDIAEANKRFAQQAQDVETGIAYPALKDQYALLVHASEGFNNYRHLADVLNVYQLLKHGGMDDEHIILVADRSIADDAYNPEKGVIRTSIDGPNLMQGAQIDYDAAQLTAADVASILKGENSSKLPTVIPPDQGHNVLLYWSGHGRSMEQDYCDEFCWRDTNTGAGFTKAMLKQAVSQMKQNKGFRKLLIVAEPCYAQSVVVGIEGYEGVLGITGANAKEQSWADNWNKTGNFWMADRFTNNLVQAIDTDSDITYRDLFLYCAQRTLGSHACIVNAAQFGNLYHTGPAEFVSKQ